MVDVRGDVQYHKEIVTGRLKFRHSIHIAKALKTHGDEVTKELQKVVTTGTRSGRVYSYRGRKYTASAPGEPPARRSGKLSKGFESKARLWELIIGNKTYSKKGAPYTKYLEEGTKKMEARPYFLITINKLHYRLEKDLQDFEG